LGPACRSTVRCSPGVGGVPPPRAPAVVATSRPPRPHAPRPHRLADRRAPPRPSNSTWRSAQPCPTWSSPRSGATARSRSHRTRPTAPCCRRGGLHRRRRRVRPFNPVRVMDTRNGPTLRRLPVHPAEAALRAARCDQRSHPRPTDHSTELRGSPLVDARVRVQRTAVDPTAPRVPHRFSPVGHRALVRRTLNLTLRGIVAERGGGEVRTLQPRDHHTETGIGSRARRPRGLHPLQKVRPHGPDQLRLNVPPTSCTCQAAIPVHRLSATCPADPQRVEDSDGWFARPRRRGRALNIDRVGCRLG